MKLSHTMKILAFVDIHGQKKLYEMIRDKIKKEDPDIILNCGDFTIFENDVKRMMYNFSRFKKKMFLVHGNHEEENVIKALSRNYPDLEFVHGRIAKFKDLVILGWGGGGFTVRDREFEDWIRSVRKNLKEYEKEGKKIIFISHGPFYKTSLDMLHGEHRGNKSFRNFIKEFNVSLGFCGHFHENSGKEDKIKNCRVFNPGPKGIILEV